MRPIGPCLQGHDATQTQGLPCARRKCQIARRVVSLVFAEIVAPLSLTGALQIVCSIVGAVTGEESGGGGPLAREYSLRLVCFGLGGAYSCLRMRLLTL